MKERTHTGGRCTVFKTRSLCLSSLADVEQIHAEKNCEKKEFIGDRDLLNITIKDFIIKSFEYIMNNNKKNFNRRL